MSRATLQDQAFLGHQGGYPTIMRQHPDQGAGGDRRPSRLLQMREDYQRRLMKEKEDRMVHTFEDHQRKNLERVDRVAKVPAVNDEYPNSRLRQPGYMQSQIPPPGQAPSHSSVRDFFHERKDMQSKGKYMPPINQHFKDNRSRVGSGGHTYQKNSAGVDRANPLAPIQPRHGGISSAPAQPPDSRSKHHTVKQHTTSPDFDVHGHVKPNQRSPPSRKPSAVQVRGNPSPKTEKMSDFQKWQMEQNKAREDRLKKLNMRAPPSDRESRDWGGDYESEDEEVDDYDRSAREAERAMNEEIERREQELLQRIAQQQSELDRLRREREQEEELERQEAEMLRKQQAADREMRRQRQQEEARRRREEEAQARQEEEKQRMAARARQERQNFEARLDLYGDAIHDDSRYPSQPNSHRGNPFQPSSHRRNSFQPSSHDEDPFQPSSYHGNPSSQQEYPFQPSSDHRSNRGYHGDSNGSKHTTPRIAPKPPSEARRQPQSHHPRAPQRKPAPPVEDYDELRVPGPGVEVYAQAVDEEQGVKVRLAPCKVCGRKFAEDRIQKHQSACKNAHKKREAFDPTQMRTDGTDMAKYVHKGAHKKEHVPKKKANWRQQHQEFIANIRYAKEIQQMEQQGVPLKDLPPPPPSKANLDLVPCPHCGRTFNEQAAERHISRCQELKTRPVANNNRRRR